jgi:hypothetical protein
MKMHGKLADKLKGTPHDSLTTRTEKAQASEKRNLPCVGLERGARKESGSVNGSKVLIALYSSKCY